MRRRTFLMAGLASTLPAIAAGADAAAAPPAETTLIDTHQHLWDLNRLRPPWLGAGGALTRNFTAEDYRAATAGLGISAAIYVEVGVATDQRIAEAELVTALCADPAMPTKGAVIAGEPADPGFAAYLDRCVRKPWVKGIRRALHTGSPAGTCLQGAFIRGIRLLGERGLTFDACLQPGHLDDVAQLAAACPGTTLVLDHCGNADPKAFMTAPHKAPDHGADAWRRSIARIAAHPNVVCKLSGIISRLPRGVPAAEGLAPIIAACWDAFGPERVIFGSDWPICTQGASLADWVTALRTVVATRPREHQRKLFQDNARRIFALA